MPIAIEPKPIQDLASQAASFALFESLQAFHPEHSLAMEQGAKQLGLTNAGHRALIIMATIRTGAITPSDLRERLHLTSGAVTSLVDKLVTAGHVERIANTQDRRSVFLTLTPEGRRAARELRTRYSDALLTLSTPADSLSERSSLRPADAASA